VIFGSSQSEKSEKLSKTLFFENQPQIYKIILSAEIKFSIFRKIHKEKHIFKIQNKTRKNKISFLTRRKIHIHILTEQMSKKMTKKAIKRGQDLEPETHMKIPLSMGKINPIK